MLNEIGYGLQQIWNNGTYTFSLVRNDLDITDFEYICKVITDLMQGEQMTYKIENFTITVLP